MYYFKGTTEISKEDYLRERERERQTKLDDRHDLKVRLLLGAISGGFMFLITRDYVPSLIVFVLVASIAGSKSYKDEACQVCGRQTRLSCDSCEKSKKFGTK